MAEESVRRWEKGGSRPSPELLATALDRLHVEPSFFDRPDADVDPGDDGDRRAELARRLRRRRAEVGLTQASAAQRLGVAQATYAGWEIGRAVPGREALPGLAAFLHTTVDELVRTLATPLVLDMASWPPFGRILGERRVLFGLDRHELAARLRVSPRTIATWEIGDKRPRRATIQRLAEILEVEPAVLVAALPDPVPPTTLGRVLRSRQRALGLTREALALLVGVDTATVSRWTWGHHLPTDASIARLAQALELDERSFRRMADLPSSAVGTAPH